MKDKEHEEVHLFVIGGYNRLKAKVIPSNEDEEAFLERVKKLSELETQTEQIIDQIRDPHGKRRSEIKMDIYWHNMDIEQLIILTELPRQVNATTYFVNSPEFADYYAGRGRLVKQGNVPIGLYHWFWKFLEDNNIWNLENAESREILGLGNYNISFLRGNKKHRFSVYAPHFDKELKKYRRLIDRIYWLSYFAFFIVKDAQPFLNEISKEEAKIKNEWEYSMHQKNSDNIPITYYPLPDKDGNYPPTN